MSHKWINLIAFSFVFLSGLFYPKLIMAQAIDPQYIFVRKNPMACNPSDCSQLWSMNEPTKDLYPGILDVYEKIGTQGTSQRKLGIGVLLWYNLYDFDKLTQSLRSLLEYSKIHQVPLFLSVDGFQWWDNEPGLWNWHDPNQAKYNPDNKNNVEWTCWNNSCAISKSWRNWGSEFETKAHPNIASRSFIDENKERLAVIIPIISDWYAALSPEEKWLFGGISLGTEVDIGGNFYYYKNGISTGKGLDDSVQLGYAAVKTAGIRSSGGPPTTIELNEVVRRYLTELNLFAFEKGIPRDKIFNHTGGSDSYPGLLPNHINWINSEASLNEYAAPGWSFYGNVTSNPVGFSALNESLDKAKSTHWSSPEWLSYAQNTSGWLDSLRGSLNYGNNRFINISNWENIRDKQYILDAIKTVMNEEPACWVTAPQLTTSMQNGSAMLSWEKGQHNESNYLQLSNLNKFNRDGTFKTPIGQFNVTGSSSFEISQLENGTYYWAMFADGCTDQRKTAYGSFEISGNELIATPTQAETQTETPTAVPSVPTMALSGDLNDDNHVNEQDLNIIIADFGNKYTIYDYNQMVENYGK